MNDNDAWARFFELLLYKLGRNTVARVTVSSTDSPQTRLVAFSGIEMVVDGALADQLLAFAKENEDRIVRKPPYKIAFTDYVKDYFEPKTSFVIAVISPGMTH